MSLLRPSRLSILTWNPFAVSLASVLTSLLGVWLASPPCGSAGPLWPHWAWSALAVAGAAALLGVAFAIWRRSFATLGVGIFLLGCCYAQFSVMAVIANSDTC